MYPDRNEYTEFMYCEYTEYMYCEYTEYMYCPCEM